MKKKRLIYYLILTWSLLINGCSLDQTSSHLVANAPEVDRTETSDKTQHRVTNKQMTAFFSTYLTIDKLAILGLNQRPKQIDDHYWQAYRLYKTKTNEILGKYLSSHARDQLEKQYIQDEFHYPRFLEMNDYMIIEFPRVEKAEIISKDKKNENDLYHVIVTALAKVIRIGHANDKYKWDDTLGYYVEHSGVEAEDIEEDQIKVKLNYLVESLAGESFQINSVKEKSGIYLGTDRQVNASNNSFIHRLVYTDHVESNHKEKIYQFLEVFMKQEYNFYTYYEKAYNTSFETVKLVLEKDLGLGGIIKFKEGDYSGFNPLIIPLKDDINAIEFNQERDVEVKPYIASSKNYPVYEVKIKTKATLLDGRMKNYEYIYQFTLENDMILSVRFINQLER